MGAGPNSSTASHDISEGNDSPCSPVLPTESGNEPYEDRINFRAKSERERYHSLANDTGPLRSEWTFDFVAATHNVIDTFRIRVVIANLLYQR